MISAKSLAVGLLIIGIALINISTTPIPNNNHQVQAQQQQTQTSVSHNAKGHESHQVVNFQNPSEGVVYKGAVTFNSSKPVDIIAYEDITEGQQSTNATVKVWDVDGKKYAQKPLMKNATEGTTSFEGSGILAHATSSDPYQVTFSINAAPSNKTQ